MSSITKQRHYGHAMIAAVNYHVALGCFERNSSITWGLTVLGGIGQFRNKKGTGAEIRTAIVSGMVAACAPLRLANVFSRPPGCFPQCLVKVPEF